MTKHFLNLQNGNDPKFRTIKWSNKLFQRFQIYIYIFFLIFFFKIYYYDDYRVILQNNSLPLLLSTGFEVKDVSDIYPEKVITYTRSDPALLYMIVSILETSLNVIEGNN